MKALQAVSVTVGSDGTIKTISSKLISKSASGSTSTSKASLDPARWGSTLPIRVQTAYVFGKQQGTNLADLAGKSGRFVITVTVENTTAKPTVIHYDGADANQHTDYALVGTPMTVLATADVGDGNIAHVVTNGPSPTSSGVLSQAPNGHAVVQYAAMLAPPQLSATSTFVLVEDSSKFKVPTFNFAAEPGLVTDASTASLIESAFGANGASVQQAAIDTIGKAGVAMQYALGQMRTISNALSSSSGDLGVRTVARLHSDSASLAVRLQTVGDQIRTSMDRITQSLTSAQGVADKAIVDQIGAVQALLVGDPNDPSTQVVPALVTSPGCGAPEAASIPAKLTVLQQAKLLNEWFGTLATANSACSRFIQDGIAQMVGTQAQATGPASDCATGSAADTLVCALRTSQDAIQQANASLDSQLTSINGTYNPLSLQDLGVQYATTLLPAVQKLQSDAQSVTTSNKATQAAVTALSSDKTALDAAWSQLDPNLTGAAYPYAAFDQLAQAIDPTTGTSVANLESDVDDVCAAALNASPAPSGAVTALCTPAAGVTPMHAEVDNWGKAIAAAADQWTNTTKPALKELGKQVGSVDGDIDALIAAASTSPPAKDLKTTVATLATDIDGLYDPSKADPMNAPGGVVAPTCTPDGTSASSVPPLNAVSVDAFNAICNAEGVTAAVSSAWSKLDGTVQGVVGKALGSGSSSSVDTVDTTISHLLTTWLPATQTSVASFFDTSNTHLLTSQADANTQSQDQINVANGNLQDAKTSVATTLGTAFSAATGTITKQVVKSTGDVKAADDALAASFKQLLVALGSGSTGTGLLGTMSASARDTVTQASRLGDKASVTEGGKAIQELGLDGTTRAVAELRASVGDQPGVFGGLSMPSGSSVLPIFTFTMGGN